MGNSTSLEIQRELDKLHIPSQDLRQLYSQFKQIDKDHNGFLDREEFSKGLGFLGVTSSLLSNFLFAAFDSDHNGYIDFREFAVGLTVLTKGKVGTLSYFYFRKVVLLLSRSHEIVKTTIIQQCYFSVFLYKKALK
jgi:hypothetical protein